LEKIGDILAAAGQGGANQVGGISFAIDEPEKLKQQAREKALVNAHEKASALARISGVRLGKIVSFTESDASTPIPYPIFYGREGLGGADTVAPKIEKGSLDVIIVATVTYELL
jgi:uncharacterized protein YggE